MADIDKVLGERRKSYGDYKTVCNYRSSLLQILKKNHGPNTPLVVRRGMEDVVHKLSRLIHTPDHIDSWRDISGYAKLVVEALEEIKS
jgi:hypothetical protein